MYVGSSAPNYSSSVRGENAVNGQKVPKLHSQVAARTENLNGWFGLYVYYAAKMSKLTGLVVEDEWLLRLELTEELAMAGWDAREARSGEEALTLLDQIKLEGGHVDFLITDIRLGGQVDGWSVAEAYRKIWPGIPVIYVSANPIAEKRRVEGGAFLSKPVEVEHLIMTCRQLIGDRS